jgi:hypothetical protein
LSEADECRGEGVQGGKDIKATFESDDEALELGEPGHGPFNDPSISPEPFAGFDPRRAMREMILNPQNTLQGCVRSS